MREHGDAVALLRRQANEQIRQSQRLRDFLAHEFVEHAPGLALDDFRQHPHAGGGVVLEARPRRPVQPPRREPRQAPLAVGPIRRRERGVGKTGVVNEQLLHRDRFFAVRAELRHDVRHALAQAQLTAFDEQPSGRAGDGFGAGEDAVQRVAGGVANRLEQRQLAVPGYGDLRRRQQPLVHFPPHPRHNRGDFVGVQTHRFRRFGEKLLGRHVGVSFGGRR